MRKTLLLILCLSSLTAWAQTGSIKGSIVDKKTSEALLGATVTVEGTSVGTVADVQGNFAISDLDFGSYTLVFKFVGYTEVKRTVELNSASITLDPVELAESSIGLEEVMVLASVADDRKTPVAVSNVTAVQIEERASNQEFPELLKSTPGVYTTKGGGGYGDARLTVRGFNDVNVAVMINGIPVNDMENGTIYWSNWAGLTDVTQSMQVQRGLGASKVAVPSIGGTVNILTNSTEAKRGGNVFYGVGNDGYQKAGFTVATGLMDNGWAVSLSGSKVSGDGYIEGTGFEGYNYFFNITKKINDAHILSLTGFGAPQRHGQRVNAQQVSTFKNAPMGAKFNDAWGYRDGQEVYYEDNFYHKPQFSLNHYWTINDKSELSTAVYLSVGTGGGGGTLGDWSPASAGQSAYDPKNIDALVEINRDPQYAGDAQAAIRSSRNDHKWYGLLSTYTNEVTPNLSILAGLDLRYYIGSHYRDIVDLLGADYYLDNSDVNNPNRALNVGDKYSYYNDGLVNWTGGFLQGEYSLGKLNAFANVSVSNTGYKRIDYFQYLDSDPLQESDWSNHFGYQVKGGAKYNLTTNHFVFANVGYFEKAPEFDAVFLNNDQFVNDAAENQKILSYELGYGYRSDKLAANVNLYRTSWLDRTLTSSFSPAADDPETPEDERDEEYYASLLGVNALHQGLEIDFNYKPTERLSIQGMVSLGDWEWMDDVDGQTIFNGDQDSIASFSKLYIGGLKVGDVAQHTYMLGVSYEVFDGLKLSANANVFDKLYAEYDPTNRTTEPTGSDVVQPLEMPTYWTMDAYLKYSFDIGGVNATLLGNVNNILDTEYIAEGTDTATLSDSYVYYGFGRTYTVSLKVQF